MNYSVLLIESRVSEFKDKYGKRYTQEQFDTITKNVKGKFLDWVGKHFDSINFDDNFEKLSTLLNKFEKISSNLPIKDLYGYKNLEQLRSAISEYESKQRRNIQNIEGANIVYDDKNRFIVINPLTHNASCYYGKGTKWCSAATGDEHFHRYNNDGKLFYIIDRTKPTSDPNYKVAINLKYNGDASYFDATDKPIDRGWIFGTNEFNTIRNYIDRYMNKNFADLIEIYSDEIKLKRERERLDILNRQRVHRERMNEIENRRVSNEWELDGDCPKEGLMAHAVFKFIKSSGNVEIPEGVDVYNLIPSGNHYNMTLFKFYGIEELEDMSWMAGDEDAAYSSSLEYLEGLYDDIGIDSVRKDMLEAHIDSDEIETFAREIYESLIREEPEVYIDESKRQLSRDQEEEININQRQIEQYERAIAEIKKQIYVYRENTDELNKKINQFNDIITKFKDEIYMIEANPEGDFSEDDIDDKIEEYVDAAKNYPLNFMHEFGLNTTDYVDKNSLFRDILHHDGYDNLLSTYDGYLDEIRVENSWFYVGRYD